MYARFFWARCACLAPACLGRPRLAQIVLMIAFRECIAVKYRTLPDLPPPEHFVFTMSEQIAGGVQRLHGVCVRTHEVLARTNPKYGTKWCACPCGCAPCLQKRRRKTTRFWLVCGRYYTAPRCYCLLSRTACLTAMFNLLDTMLREERRTRTPSRVSPQPPHFCSHSAT